MITNLETKFSNPPSKKEKFSPHTNKLRKKKCKVKQLSLICILILLVSHIALI